ncbi:MAG TPA: transposase [Clostridiales bacterium]|nr:transposase [Clostridiales bacterium]
MVIRTITLKLYKPSRRKREIIDDALLRYSMAYQYMLDKAFEQIEEIREKYKEPYGIYSSFKLSKWMDSTLSEELNEFGVQPFKDSLKIDLGMSLAGHLNLKRIRENTSFPLVYLPDDRYDSSYDALMDEIISEGLNDNLKRHKCEKELLRLERKSASLSPIFFCRCATNRDYCLLYDVINKKYYAKLYLMNRSDDRKKALNPSENMLLRYIHKDGGMLKPSDRKERYIIVPLSFGKWQEQYLKTALVDPSIIKTARLIKKKDEYYLAVNIDIEEEKAVETETYLGLSRDLKALACYTIVDSGGQVLETNKFTNLEVNKFAKMKCISSGAFPADVLHSIANEIVALSANNKSQVVVQSMIDKSDRLVWRDEQGRVFKPLLDCRRYNDLVKILEYKLPSRGLPPPIKVSPVGIFYKCPACELQAKKNRISKDMFICTACGQVMEIGHLGSLNLAKKPIQYSKDVLKVNVESTPIGVRLINKELGLDFKPSEDINWFDDFKKEIVDIIENFNANMPGVKDDSKSFKMKYSIIKRLESGKDLSEMIRLS